MEVETDHPIRGQSTDLYLEACLSPDASQNYSFVVEIIPGPGLELATPTQGRWHETLSPGENATKTVAVKAVEVGITRIFGFRDGSVIADVPLVVLARQESLAERISLAASWPTQWNVDGKIESQTEFGFDVAVRAARGPLDLEVRLTAPDGISVIRVSDSRTNNTTAQQESSSDGQSLSFQMTAGSAWNVTPHVSLRADRPGNYAIKVDVEHGDETLETSVAVRAT